MSRTSHMCLSCVNDQGRFGCYVDAGAAARGKRENKWVYTYTYTYVLKYLPSNVTVGCSWVQGTGQAHGQAEAGQVGRNAGDLRPRF